MCDPVSHILIHITGTRSLMRASAPRNAHPDMHVHPRHNLHVGTTIHHQASMQTLANHEDEDEDGCGDAREGGLMYVDNVSLPPTANRQPPTVSFRAVIDVNVNVTTSHAHAETTAPTTFVRNFLDLTARCRVLHDAVRTTLPCRV
mgnify:FL=1